MKAKSGASKEAEKGIAFFWDESFLWGLMSYKALRANGLSFDLIRSDDIRRGGLKGYSMLFVPGGWASNKMKALGNQGAAEVQRFVRDGGAYLGFCGGAGLATIDGLALLPVKRKPTKERVPSFSGRIRLDLRNHPIWEDLRESEPPGKDRPLSHVFQAWWPSQFLVGERDAKVVATYGEALPDAYSSDLNVGDMAVGGSWDEFEKIYGIKLDPERLRHDPAIVEGSYGKGRVMLSLIHFDTPGDENGSIVLRNLWKYLAAAKPEKREGNGYRPTESCSAVAGAAILRAVTELESEVRELISLGMRNFLWFWKNPMLLQWRRGVRGLEYCTLYVMVEEIAEIIRSGKVSFLQDGDFMHEVTEGVAAMGPLLSTFVGEAKRLLIMERLAMQNGHITYEKCDDPVIQRMRTALFSNTKSHGGLFKELIAAIDRVLFTLIRRAES